MLRGAFARATRPSKIPPKISCTPCQARFQSPVNTPRTKSMIPSKIRLMEFQMFFTLVKNPLRIPPRTGPKTSVQSFAKMFCRKSSTFCSSAWISSPFTAMSATSATIAATTIPIGDVRNAIAAPKAVVAAVATAQIAFQAVTAATCAHCAAVSATFAAVPATQAAVCRASAATACAEATTKSLAYSAMICRSSALSFNFAIVAPSTAFFIPVNAPVMPPALMSQAENSTPFQRPRNVATIPVMTWNAPWF